VPRAPIPRSVTRLLNQAAVEKSWAFTDDRSARTAPARAAAAAKLNDQFAREVDPDGVLDPVDRARRAEHLRRAHFRKLAAASALKRANRKAAS
jgi:hypothetical protein